MTTQPPQTTTIKAPVQKVQHDLRLIVGEDGRFLYISPDMLTLLRVQEADVSKQNCRDILNFVDKDDALNDRVVILRPGGANLEQDARDPYTCSIREGLHDIVIGEQTIAFQFDWIQTEAGGQGTKSCLIASADPTGAKELGQTMKQMVRDMMNRAAPSPVRKSIETPKPMGASARLREEDLRQFLTLGEELMIVCDLDGTVQRYSPSVSALLGQDDILGCNMSDFVAETDRPKLYSTLVNLSNDDASRGHMPVMQDCQMGDDNVQWHIRRRERTLYCMGHVLTKQRVLQTALQKQKTQLDEAHSIARMGHWYWNVGHKAIEWSDQIYTIFGLDSQAFIPTLDSVNRYIHKSDVGRIYQAFQRALIGHNQYNMDFRIRRADGEERIILCEGRCETDQDGDATALYGVIRDITEEKIQELNLRNAKEDAENAYAAKSRFLANMSHELRTPLNAIIGFSELMEQQVLGPLNYDGYKDYITGVHESGQHLLDLITDILDMSKIEAGKYELTYETVNVSKIIRTSVHMLEGRVVDGGLTIRNKMPDKDVMIQADRRAIMQIILNILSNAVKFTESGGTVTIEAMHDQESDMIAVQVMDTGIGIADDKIRHVTKPFEQVSNAFSRGHQGSGLGLAITKDLLTLHNGDLTLDSVLGEGTCVTITIPVGSHG